MLKEIEDRISGLEQATEILRDHVFQHGHRMESKPLEFITKQIDNFKREIKIRKDFPILKDL
ncbi:MAG: hypothetical protein ACFFBP_02720 [Promethearchaeota archaeon]